MIPVIYLIRSASYIPEDGENNANDDFATLADFVRRNSKSNLAKQLE